jgi:tetratricopeptide (TPR) repeat protein
MTIEPNQIETRYSQLRAALAGAPPTRELPKTQISRAISFAREALKAGRSELAVALLELLVGHAPAEADAWQLLGFAFGEEQRIPEAAGAFARAAKINPHEPLTALAHAQASLDAGFPAAKLFEHALGLGAANLAAINGWAASLAAEGRRADADSLLAETLVRHPDWLAGHKSLSALRFTSGDSPHFDRSYAQSCTVQPQNLPLRLAWFSAIAQTHDWDAALRIVGDGEKIFGATSAFAVARTFIASESGDHALAEQLFARTAAIRDDVLGIAHMRHCLRTAQLEKAEKLALSLMKGPSAHMIWPYLSLIWRLRGDRQAQWLDGAPPYIRAFDLDYSPRELEELAAVLRGIHTAPAPYLEQSVRGGTQTDTERQLFFRAEPEIQKVRATVCVAIREFLAGLPPHLPGHPLLGAPRGRIRFSGSWSVRLRSQGFHVSHTHPMGWISSALYVSLPQRARMGAAPAGWISFGRPPQVLGLNLPPYAQLEPKPGRLILFSSTMWHETLPFADGERLVIAFDVMKPRLPPPSEPTTPPITA